MSQDNLHKASQPTDLDAAHVEEQMRWLSEQLDANAVTPPVLDGLHEVARAELETTLAESRPLEPLRPATVNRIKQACVAELSRKTGTSERLKFHDAKSPRRRMQRNAVAAVGGLLAAAAVLAFVLVVPASDVSSGGAANANAASLDAFLTGLEEPTDVWEEDVEYLAFELDGIEEGLHGPILASAADDYNE